MNAKEVGTMALIAGVGAAAMMADTHRHLDGVAQRSAAGTKHYRKQRDKKKRMSKASKKRNRR